MSFDSERALASRWTPWIFNVAVAIVARLVLPVDLADRGERYAYVAMSRAFPLPQCPTFHCFRFLPPLFASLPTLETIDAFIVTGVVFQVLAGVVLWHLAAHISRSSRVAWLTTAWYWVTWAPILSLTDPLLITDPVQAFWGFATLYLLLTRRDALAFAMLVVGAAVKESVLLVPVAYAVYVALTRSRSEWRPLRVAALGIAPVAAWIGLRAILHTHHGYSIAGDSSYLRKTYLLGVWLPGFGPWPLNARMAALYIFGTFGAGWVAAALGWMRTSRRERALAVGSAPAMLLLALYQVPDRALATYPYAVLIAAARYVSAWPAAFVALVLLVNAALTIRLNAAPAWLPSSSALIGVLAVLMAAGAWLVRQRGAMMSDEPAGEVPPDTSTVARVSMAVLAVALSLVGFFVWRSAHLPPAQRLRLENGLSVADDEAITPGLAISRDGRRLAFVGADTSGIGRLWLRDTNATATTALNGTENATAPFWSPDGSRLGFFAHGRLKVVDVRTGHVAPLADAPEPRGGAWGADDVIVFAPTADGALSRVTAGGGAPTAATTLDESAHQRSHRWPSFLPDGRRFVFTVTGATADDRSVHLGSVASTAPVHLLDHAGNAQYADGYLLFASTGSDLRALPFDLRRGRAFGSPLIVADQIASSRELSRGAFASSTSTLVYATTTAREQLTAAATAGQWVERDGRPSPAQPAAPALGASDTEVSPDGRWVASTSLDSGAAEIVVRPNGSNGAPRRVSAEGGRHPHWRGDSREIFFVVGDRFVASAELDDAAPPRFRASRHLFAVDFPPGDSTHQTSDFAVSADGRQIFVRPIAGQHPSAPAVVVEGWRHRLRLP